MPRVTENNPRKPFPGGPLGWETIVSSSGRIRLPVQIIEYVGWLRTAPAGSALNCVGQVGSKRQLLLMPTMPVDMHELGEKIAGSTNTDGEELEESVLEFARHAASMWSITLSGEHKKRRREFTLPRGARLIGVAPKAGEPAVIFAFASRLEVWRHEAWVDALAEFETNRADKMVTLTELFDD
jgi:hypothetical protein